MGSKTAPIFFGAVDFYQLFIGASVSEAGYAQLPAAPDTAAVAAAFHFLADTAHDKEVGDKRRASAAVAAVEDKEMLPNWVVRDIQNGSHPAGDKADNLPIPVAPADSEMFRLSEEWEDEECSVEEAAELVRVSAVDFESQV